ncbi:hypothetical protein D3C72_2497980 [compost metagenome]
METFSASEGTNMMKMAPKIAPYSVPTPPTTMPTSSEIDRKSVNESGATNCTAMADSAPPTPV